MTSPSETTMNQMATEDETGMLERIPVPAEPLPTESTDPLPTESLEPLPTESTDPLPTESTDLLPTESTEPLPTESTEPLPTESTEPLPTESTEPLPMESPEPLPTESTESPAASASANLSERWHEIQAMFVDDPRSSAEMAADLVDESVQALVASVRQQQDSLLAAWHGENADTEELRTAVQHYRAFGGRLADFTG
jgi:hypothetical protein